MNKLSSMLRAALFALVFTGSTHVPLAHAAVEEVADEDLSTVSGEDGVSISLHLEWNADALTSVDLTDSSSISITYYEHGATSDLDRHTSMVFGGFGGILDMWALHIDARKGPAGVGDYVDVTLPTLVAFNQFGVRTVYAQSYSGTDPATAPAPTVNYGKWLLNGAATVTGNVYIWPAK